VKAKKPIEIDEIVRREIAKRRGLIYL